MDNTLIFDFETLSQNPINGALVSCALLTFDIDKLSSNSYTYEELLESVVYFKFDVEVTSKYATEGRNINNVTSTMLAQFTSNIATSNGLFKGRRRFLSKVGFDLGFPNISPFS